MFRGQVQHGLPRGGKPERGFRAAPTTPVVASGPRLSAGQGSSYTQSQGKAPAPGSRIRVTVGGKSTFFPFTVPEADRPKFYGSSYDDEALCARLDELQRAKLRQADRNTEALRTSILRALRRGDRHGENRPLLQAELTRYLGWLRG